MINIERLSFYDLSSNDNPYAIKLLKNNLYKVSWKCLSSNKSPYAIEILKDNLNKVDLYNLSLNPKDGVLMTKYLNI